VQIARAGFLLEYRHRDTHTKSHRCHWSPYLMHQLPAARNNTNTLCYFINGWWPWLYEDSYWSTVQYFAINDVFTPFEKCFYRPDALPADQPTTSKHWRPEWSMRARLCIWVKVQICTWPSWCHCHSLSLAPVNPDWLYLPGFTFLVLAHLGSPKRAVKQCGCVCVCEIYS